MTSSTAVQTVRFTVLGCGSSSGTPAIGCACATCLSTNPKNRRSRCSAWVEVGQQSWVIDTGPDFRQQALRAGIGHLDGVLYTHPHADHLNGIDDLRAFCYRQQAVIPVYANRPTLDNICSRFDYAFLPPQRHWNKPVLSAHVLSGSLNIAGVPLQHFDLPHGPWQTTAYRIGNIAWLTDINDVSEPVIAALQGLDYLFLDCLMDGAYPSHLSVEQAFDFARRIGAGQTYLIHMTHMLEYAALQARCPKGVAVAYDGLSVTSSYASSGR